MLLNGGKRKKNNQVAKVAHTYDPFVKNYFYFYIYMYIHALRAVWRDGYPNVSTGNFQVGEFFSFLYIVVKEESTL